MTRARLSRSASDLQPIIRIAMTSSGCLSSLLVAALAFLALPSYGTAQAPRRPTHAASGRDARPHRGPLRRGRRADRQARRRDPNVVAVKARALIARGRYREAEALLRPVAARAPTSEAALELGLLQQMLGRPDATAMLERVAPHGRHEPTIRTSWRAPRARCARSAASRKPTPRIATPRATRAERRRDQDGVGRAVPREARQRRGAEVVPDGAEGRSALGAGAARPGARARRRQPAAGGQRSPSARSRSTRRRSTRTCSSPSRRSTPARTTRRARRSQKALAVNPSSLEAHALLAAHRLRRGQAAGVRGRGRQDARDRAELRRGLPRRRRAGRAQLPLRRGGRADAPRARARRRATRARWPTSACTCCAPATSRRRATALERRSSSIRYDARHLQPARRCWTRSTSSSRSATATSSCGMRQGRSAGAAGVRDAAGAAGARHAARSATSSRRRGRS